MIFKIFHKKYKNKNKNLCKYFRPAFYFIGGDMNFGYCERYVIRVCCQGNLENCNQTPLYNCNNCGKDCQHKYNILEYTTNGICVEWIEKGKERNNI